jgi:uncharacterized Ntn-hydrolase superfamily protein
VTFSIVARCPRTGMLGVAVASRALASGGAVPHCRARVGAIASQAFSNHYLGIDGLQLLEQGLPAARALERVLEQDRGRDLRQVGIVDAGGHTAAHTGEKCIPWAGQIEGGGYVCLGNILAGKEVVEEMSRAFEDSSEEDLPERLLLALEAGEEAGGDRRGRQAAGIYVVHVEEYPTYDYRVDDHPNPIPELRRIVALARGNEAVWELLAPRRDDFAPNLESLIRLREMIASSLEEEEEPALPASGHRPTEEL